MKHYLRPVILLVLALPVSGAEITGKVAANRLYVRAAPGRNFEVVARLRQGDKVSVVRFKWPWLGISPPKNARAWIRVDALNNGTVSAGNATVHAGPGTAFSVFATLKSGDKVTVRKVRRGTWAQIEPPAGAVVWVHGNYVELPAKYRRKESARPEKAAPPKTGKKWQPDAHPELVKIDKPLRGTLPASLPVKAAKDCEVYKLEGEPETGEIKTFGAAKNIARSGVVIELEPGKNRPWRHALAARINNIFYPLLYLDPSFKGLEQWKWRRVRVTGTQYWVKGWSRPLMLIKKLEEIKDAEKDKEKTDKDKDKD